jgi:membrane protein required for colicin V production
MSGTLNILDLLFIMVFFFSIIFGIIRGLVRELLSLGFLIAALIIAFIYYQDLGLLLNGLLEKRDMADLAGFLLLLLLVAAVGSLISRLLSKYLVIGPLKGLDRMLGAVFGLLRATLLAGIIIYSFMAFPLNNELCRQSQLAPYLIRGIVLGVKIMPPAVQDKLKSIKIYDYKKNRRNSRTI